MRAAVAHAWPGFCTAWEGRLDHMYLDTKGLVTTGTGNLIDDGSGHPPPSALALPWLTKAGARADQPTVAAEWRQIKARDDLSHRGGYAYAKVATLHLAQADLNALLAVKTGQFWAALASQLAGLEAWPADAQLALMDMAWHMGPHFLGAGWPRFTKAARAADYAGMAAACSTAAKTPRDGHHQRLYRNAAQVRALHLNPETLWNDRAPAIVPPRPPKDDDMPRRFRTGTTCACVATSLPRVERYMILTGLIRESIDLFQLGYRTDVTASAGTHSRGGCVDTGQFSPAQIEAWRLFGWTMQRRDLPGVVTHAHGWPLGCPHLAPAAQAQARDWARGDNGLVGSVGIVGRYPVDDWQTALRRMETVMAGLADDVAKGVLDLDTLENVFTGNDANKTVTLRTAVVTLGKRSRSTEARLAKIEALLEKIAAQK